VVACEVLTQTFVPVGGLVVGPFAGIGTVPPACRRTGRHYLGIEQSRRYVQIALGRQTAKPTELKPLVAELRETLALLEAAGTPPRTAAAT
jgi:DNA modification methylase